MNDYYIYAHVNAKTGIIFYIGKGKNGRSKSLHRRSNRWHNYVNKYGFNIIHLEEGLTQEQSFLGEVHYIKAFGRKDFGTGELINMSDGGVGGNNNKGRKLSEEWRKKISEASKRQKGIKKKPHSEQSKKKISIALKGRKTPWVNVNNLNKTKICPYCNREFRLAGYTLFHGERCKQNQNRTEVCKKVWPRGEKSVCSKISDSDALKIRELYNQDGKSKKQIMVELSEKYGISTHSVRHIGLGNRRTNEPISNEPRVHKSTKLTLNIAMQIRDEYKAGGTSHMKLGRKYGVSAPTISQIIHNQAWKMI